MEVFSKFGIIFEILSFGGYSSDEAITFLTQLCRRTYDIWIINYSIFLGDFFAKRIITLKHRNQKYLRDPRLGWFRLKVKMNNNLKPKDLEKFVSYFDNLLETNQSQDQDSYLNIYQPKKRKSRLRKLKLNVFSKWKLINLEFIHQNALKPLSLKYYADIFCKHEPNLLLYGNEKCDVCLEFFPESCKRRLRK